MKHATPSRIAGAFFAAALGLAVCAHATDTESRVYNFEKAAGGYYPSGNLLMDASGNLFGTAFAGPGREGTGTVFELSPVSGGGYTYSVIYTFNGSAHEYGPVGSLVMDAAGNLYGSTSGTTTGEIFELSPTGSGVWTESVLYVLNSNEGTSPSPVVLDAAGNLYGTSTSGGASNVGYVFELSPVSGGGWNYQHLHEFSGTDGFYPEAGVVLDASGNIYGTTAHGGSSTNCVDGCGVVFELSHASGSWVDTTIHSFSGPDGSDPVGPLTLDAAGNLYGTAGSGGTSGKGVVFELSLVSGVWKGHALHNFVGANGDGAFPNTALVLSGGNLYGTTASGGGGLNGCVIFGDYGCGSVFELSPSGTNWKTTILHDFSGLGDGGTPQGVILDASGNPVGMTQAGGAKDGGVVFKLTPPAAK